MIEFLFCYQFVFTFVLIILDRRRTKYNEFPKLILKSTGIEFFSHFRHRIRVDESKYLVMDNRVYIRFGSRLVSIINVKNVYFKKGFIYFSCMGKTKICTNFSAVYKYFNLLICSNEFDLSEYRDRAIKSLIENKFKYTKEFKRYIHIVRDILKINVDKKKISVGQNKFRLKFEMIYKINGKMKKVIVG